MSKSKFNKTVIEGFRGEPLQKLPLSISLVRKVEREMKETEENFIEVKKYEQIRITTLLFYKPISKMDF